MEGPGISLFQGAESIQLDTSAQGLEEDEEQEDIKRRNEEINDLLTNAFDDLDDDDISSVNSSHYQNSTRDYEHFNTGDSCQQQGLLPQDNTISQFQKEFGVYDRREKSNNYNHNVITNHQPVSESGPTVSDVQREFGIYEQADMSYNKSNRNNDITIAETPYEITRVPRHEHAHNDHDQINEGYTLSENYPCNYNTPANHYDHPSKKYPNNGYIDRFKNNVLGKDSDDFGGGDNCTSEHINHCYKTSPNGILADDDNRIYKSTEYDSKEQLEVLYTVRMREIKRLTKELEQVQIEKEEEKDQLNRKIALLQAEVERSNISRSQAQHAAVDAKAEVADLHSQIQILKERNAILEKSNQNITEELTTARGSVIDLQEKIAVLERVQALQANDKTHEKFLKQAQEKHAIEMKNMQTQIDILTDKLNAKETAYTALENTLADVRRAHEALMVEKADTMNRLSQALEESQTQCRNLMASNNAQQIMQLQTQIQLLNQEKEENHKIIQELQNKLEVAKSDVAQYDSLLATTFEDESDSIRQMKLGEVHNRSKSKPSDDMTNKLRGELQRCIAGHAVKRKEINRLENTLAQKQKELDKALKVTETCQQEAAQYAKRVAELEQELKSVLTDHAKKANSHIQKLSDHLNDMKKQNNLLREEKSVLEQKLEESLAMNQESIRKHQESISQMEKNTVNEYNKEYLEIHSKAIERVKQEAQVEIVQLSVQLEQTQKELNRVKELYIDVCGTKELLISEHKNEVKILKEKYANMEARFKDLEKLEYDLLAQCKLSEKLTKECESYREKIMQLEQEISYERKKKSEYTKKIHEEIEKAKEEALKELSNAHPNQQISVFLPDHCSEHLEKINQLEEDCKRLEEKLHTAVEEHKQMLEYQSQLDDAKLKMAQMEISQESWKMKYDNAATEKKDLLTKVVNLESELTNIKKGLKMQDSDDTKLKIANVNVENETLKNKCDSLLNERNACREKISQLEMQLSESQKVITSLETKVKRRSEISSSSRCELEKELSQYKDTAAQLSKKLNELKTSKSTDILEQKIKQLEKDLQIKDEKLQSLKDFDKIKEERDQLLFKLKNQAKQFEQYVKSQKQVSAELNLSPRSLSDATDFQKIKEIMIKEVREEMEQKVVQELRSIEEHHREKRKEAEESYKSALLELQMRYKEKTQEVETLKAIVAEKVKLQASFKAKEQFISQLIESKLETYHQELETRKLKIEQLQEEIKQKENDAEEERNVMAQLMTNWASEIRDIKAKEVELNREIERFKEIESRLREEIKTLQEKKVEMKNNIDTLKHQYQAAKKSVTNYKELAEKKEKFLLNECKRIEEGYKKAMDQVQEKLDKIVSTQEEEVAMKLKEIECQYTEQLEQMRLKLKYKSKC